MSDVFHAIASGNIASVRAALAADGSARDRAGRTPLMEAVLTGRQNIVEAVLAHGADVKAKDKLGWTALHYAAQDYYLEVAQLLLEHGADSNARDEHGNGPLLRATFNSRERGEMIRLPLANGADPVAKNAHGVSALDLANTIANYDVEAVLSASTIPDVASSW
jgi:ankyrin repeat protein